MGRKDPLEEGMAAHSSIPAWRIPWTEEPGGLWAIESQRPRHDWSGLASTHVQTGPNPWPFCPQFSNLSVFRPRPHATAQESIYILMSDHFITKGMTKWTKVHSQRGRAVQTPTWISCRAHSFSGLNSTLEISHVTQYLCWDWTPRGVTRSLPRAQRDWSCFLLCEGMWKMQRFLILDGVVAMEESTWQETESPRQSLFGSPGPSNSLHTNEFPSESTFVSPIVLKSNKVRLTQLAIWYCI